MAIKLIGVDVPNTTAQPQPELGVPTQPEDSSKTALQMTSQGLQNTNETMARTNASMAEIAASIPRGTQQALGASLEYENRVIQSKAANQERGFLSGGKNLADTVIRFVEADQRRASAEAEAKAKALKQEQDDEFFRLSATVDGFTSQIQTALRTNPGGLPEFERQFKTLVNDNERITPEHRAKLYSQFYGAISPINAEQGRNLVENQEKYQAASRANKIAEATMQVSPILTWIKHATSEEVRQENIAKLDAVYQQIMTNQTLSDFDRITIVANIREQANVSLKDSLEAQAIVVNKANNFTSFIRDANEIRRKRQSGEFTQADYEAQIGFAAQRYEIPDSIAKVYRPNYDLETSVDNMKLLQENDDLVLKRQQAAEDAVPFGDLLIGSLVAQSRGDKNSSVLTKLIPGSNNYKRVVGVIDDYNEYIKLRAETNQQNLLLRGNALSNNEAFARALLARVKGNTSVNRQMLANMGIEIKNASLFDALIQGKTDPQQEQQALADLREVYVAQNATIAERQRGNLERLRILESRMNAYGLKDGFERFDWKAFEAQQKVFNQRKAVADEARRQEALRVNPNAQPGGQSNLFFKVPQLAKVQAGAKGVSFVPFKPGTDFTVTGAYKEDRGTHAHAGEDYAAPAGTPILAHIPMRVVRIENDPKGYGHYVTTQGADGFYYRYSHLPARPSLNVGQELGAGQVFAKVGSSGRSTGAHLHFEVRTNADYGDSGTLDPIEHMKRYVPNTSPKLPRGQNYEKFYGSGQAVSPQRASIPKDALPLRGGLFVYKGQVYDKESLMRVNETRYSPAMPIRQQNNSSNKANYKASDADSNHGYAVLARDAGFRRELNATAKRLGIPPVWLADVMADETGGTFSANIPNGKGHYGLIQFDDGAARGVGTTLDQLVRMTPTQQLKYVEKYIRQRTNNGKWITSPHDLKAAIWYGNSSPDTMRKLWSQADAIDDGQITWRDFANRLGRYAGRKYDSPLTRRERLQSRLRNDTPSLVASESTSMYMEVSS